MDLAAFPASSLKRLWLLPPEAASSTSGPVVLSKVSTLKQGWGWEGEAKRQNGAGAWEALPSLEALEDGDSWAHVTFIHSANSQGHLLGVVQAQKCDSSKHHEGLEGKERLDSNSKKEDQENRRCGEGGSDHRREHAGSMKPPALDSHLSQHRGHTVGSGPRDIPSPSIWGKGWRHRH